MQSKRINSIIKWWVTPKLPDEDIFVHHNFVSQWVTHPVKRRLARWYLKFLQKYTDIRVIGITGSSGKTTTKEMLASILRLEGKTVFTKESIDPVYNIPNTILRCTPLTKYLVLEMSVEYPGEMDFYLWLAQPGIGLITNIFPVHTKYLKNKDGVLKEKSKLVLGLSGDSVAVLNSGDPLLKNLAKKLKVKVVWFPKNNDFLVENGFAASIVADYLGIRVKKIKNGLANYNRPKHRFEIIEHKSGAIIFDDSYNSNPKAVLAALSLFLKKAGKNNKIAVLGDMLELGELEKKLHREIGRQIAKSGFQMVIGVGNASKYIIDEVEKNGKYTKTCLVETADQATPLVAPFLHKGVYLFIKGSRSVGLDKMVEELV